MILSTLCYIEKDDKYLMLHRTKKKKDINKNKWLGIGRKLNVSSPCLLKLTFKEKELVNLEQIKW